MVVFTNHSVGLCPVFSMPLAGLFETMCQTGLYPKDLEQLLKPSELNPSPVTLPPPFPGLARLGRVNL